MRHISVRRRRSHLDLARGRAAVDLRLPHDHPPARPRTAYTIPLKEAVRAVDPEQAVSNVRTFDAGATWSDLRVGLPQEGAFLTVLREALAVDPLTPHGIYFGTTSGELFASDDEGA